MTISFTTAQSSPQPPPDQSDIIVNGAVIGTIRPAKYIGIEPKWHAIIRVNGTPTGPYLLLQGFGNTHEEAVTAAVLEGHKSLSVITDSFHVLASQIGVIL